MHLHYTAPIAALFLLFPVQSMRHLRLWRWGRLPAGRYIVTASLVLCFVSVTVFCKNVAQQARAEEQFWSIKRARILAGLTQDGDKHLVVVRYGPEHPPQHEWVHNEADIDNARVVWARDMGGDANRELVDYFRARRIWLLQINDTNPELVPYLAGASE